ncbi:MAG: hypothetical protein R3A12_02445 [Ignavibacteria bacterium]
MNPVVHFEMPYEDKQRAASFLGEKADGAYQMSDRKWVIML